MSWWQIGLVLGAMAPLLFMWGAIRIALKERGVVAAAGLWAGGATLTIPAALLVCWIGSLF